MRTWWIVRNDYGKAVVVDFSYAHSTIGPYFSYTEAMGMLHFWMK